MPVRSGNSDLHGSGGLVKLGDEGAGLLRFFALGIDDIFRRPGGEGLIGQLGLDALEVFLRLLALGGDARVASPRCMA